MNVVLGRRSLPNLPGHTVHLTEVLAGELVGVESTEVDDYHVWFGPIQLGSLEPSGRFRAKNPVLSMHQAVLFTMRPSEQWVNLI
jgi:hypothetical protein